MIESAAGPPGLNPRPTPDDSRSAFAATDLSRTYYRGAEPIHALRGVTLDIGYGEMVTVMGTSGSGKTTLLNLFGCLDLPSGGSLRVAGQELLGLREGQLNRLRREGVGIVFQHFRLVPTLTVAENVALPLLFRGRSDSGAVDRLLKRVGLFDRRDHQPHQLSGGEMQRTAIARALVNGPRILLADEPTGSLDSSTGDSILGLFQELHHEGLTVVVVTHNPAIAALAPRQITLHDGQMVSDSRAGSV